MAQFIADVQSVVSFEFDGVAVKLVSHNQYFLQVKVNGETFRYCEPFASRGAAAREALRLDRFCDQCGFIDGIRWDSIGDDDSDKAILERAYKQYRSEGRSPAVSIVYARNQVEFAHNGW